MAIATKLTVVRVQNVYKTLIMLILCHLILTKKIPSAITASLWL